MLRGSIAGRARVVRRMRVALDGAVLSPGSPVGWALGPRPAGASLPAVPAKLFRRWRAGQVRVPWLSGGWPDRVLCCLPATRQGTREPSLLRERGGGAAERMGLHWRMRVLHTGPHDHTGPARSLARMFGGVAGPGLALGHAFVKARVKSANLGFRGPPTSAYSRPGAVSRPRSPRMRPAPDVPRIRAERSLTFHWRSSVTTQFPGDNLWRKPAATGYFKTCGNHLKQLTNTPDLAPASLPAGVPEVRQRTPGSDRGGKNDQPVVAASWQLAATTEAIRTERKRCGRVRPAVTAAAATSAAPSGRVSSCPRLREHHHSARRP